VSASGSEGDSPSSSRAAWDRTSSTLRRTARWSASSSERLLCCSAHPNDASAQRPELLADHDEQLAVGA
jgi:hypothetical protein